MRLLQVQVLASLFLAAVLSAPAWASNASPNSAVPGTVNYVEGQVYVADKPVDQKAIGKTVVEVGQSIRTDQGKAEVLLTPGVFLRVGNNTSVEMKANSLTFTALRLTQGHAIVEVDDIYPQNNLRITEGDATARMLKPGLYDFNLRENQARVFDGLAVVHDRGKEVKLKGGHELSLAENEPVKAEGFKKKTYETGDLYDWSSLRSSYVAEANVDAANTIVDDGWGWGGWWGDPFWGAGFGWGWDWDPWFGAYTFMPWGGICYSPFGWGFYSPGLVHRAPFYGGHFNHTFNAANVRSWGAGSHYATSRNYAHGVYTGRGAVRGAFHSGPAMAHNSFGGFRGASGFHGGGFRGGGSHGGGGGGFHGGGGGGFHGGGGFRGGGGGHGGGGGGGHGGR